MENLSGSITSLSYELQEFQGLSFSFGPNSALLEMFPKPLNLDLLQITMSINFSYVRTMKAQHNKHVNKLWSMNPILWEHGDLI